MTIGTGPVYGPGVSANVGRLSRSGHAAGRVGPVQGRVDGKQWGRNFPFPSTSSLIHLIRTGLGHLASIVSEGALWMSRPRLLVAP